jgi:hypothetical protein
MWRKTSRQNAAGKTDNKQHETLPMTFHPGQETRLAVIPMVHNATNSSRKRNFARLRMRAILVALPSQPADLSYNNTTVQL